MLATCAGRVDPCALWVAFAGRVREPKEKCVRVRGERGIRNSLCGLLNVDSIHVKVTCAKKLTLQTAFGAKV